LHSKAAARHNTKQQATNNKQQATTNREPITHADKQQTTTMTESKADYTLLSSNEETPTVATPVVSDPMSYPGMRRQPLAAPAGPPAGSVFARTGGNALQALPAEYAQMKEDAYSFATTDLTLTPETNRTVVAGSDVPVATQVTSLAQAQQADLSKANV
jgi:hypothetical protein